MNMSASVQAAKYSYTSATHTEDSEYKYVGYDVYTENLDVYTKRTKRYVHQKGNVWSTGEKSVSDNYWHEYGEKDLHAEKSISKTHTFSTSTTHSLPGKLGAELGYGYSETSEKSVTMDISSKRPSGYYFVGVKAKMIDLRVVHEVYIYDRYNGYNRLKNIYTYNDTGVSLYDGDRDLSPLYYYWYEA